MKSKWNNSGVDKLLLVPRLRLYNGQKFAGRLDEEQPGSTGGLLTSKPPWMDTFGVLHVGFFRFLWHNAVETCELKERPMLVLSRKLNESIVINDNVVVTVLVSRVTTCDSASTHHWKSRTSP